MNILVQAFIIALFVVAGEAMGVNLFIPLIIGFVVVKILSDSLVASKNNENEEEKQEKTT